MAVRCQSHGLLANGGETGNCQGPAIAIRAGLRQARVKSKMHSADVVPHFVVVSKKARPVQSSTSSQKRKA